MSRPILAALPFLAALATAPAAAQRAAAPVALPEAATSSNNASTAHRIFTLTWVEERLPAGLVESSLEEPGPSGLQPRRIFTLVWQQLPGEPVAVHPARPVATEACRIVTLVAEPCR